ncbi:MAG: hypothetical protein ACFFE5_03515, partial [Candidatus Thorarchaeota archaeon]
FSFKHLYNQELVKLSQVLNAKLLLRKGDRVKSEDKTMKSEILPQNELDEKINSEELITKSLQKTKELDKMVKDSSGDELNKDIS